MADINLRAQPLNIFGTVGDDLSIVLTVVDSAGDPIDVSGYTIAGKVWRGVTEVDEMTDAVSGASNNVITLSFTDTETTAIGTERRLRWSLSMTSGGTTEQWVGGKFELVNAGHPKASGTSAATLTYTSGNVTVTLGSISTTALDGRYAPGVVLAESPTGVAATDQANLEAAIAATPTGGILELRAGDYRINAPLVLDDAILVRGVGVRPILASPTESLPDLPGNSSDPDAATIFAGTTISQTASGVDAIQITGGAQASLEGFGIIFKGAHVFDDTGHGINVVVPVDENGITLFSWRNLAVYGHDGDHYAYKIVNPMHGNISDVRSYGGGVMSIESVGDRFNFGNLVINHPFGFMFCGGTAHGYHMDAESASGQGRLNFCTFIRPQVNITTRSSLQATVPNTNQKTWNMEGNVDYNRDHLVIAPDLENGDSAFSHSPTFTRWTRVIQEGGFFPDDQGVYRSNWANFYNKDDPPTISVNATNTNFGAGSIPNATDKSTSIRGVITLTMGSSPVANATLATINFAVNLVNSPRFVMLHNLGSAADPGFWAVNSDASKFEIRARNPAGGATYSIGYYVVE